MTYLKAGIVLAFLVTFANAWSFDNKGFGRAAITLSALLFIIYIVMRFMYGQSDSSKGGLAKFLDIAALIFGLISLLIAPFVFMTA